MILSLVGLPGSGKSSVGALFARKLNLSFLDSDHVIEQRIGCSIRDYFEAAGEQAFRDVEQTVIEEITQSENVVIATGGGAVLRPGNRDALRGRTRVFYLRARPEDLILRLARDTRRPLLQVADPIAKLQELFAARDPLYQETAHYEVPTARQSVSRVAHLICTQLEQGSAPGAITTP